MSTMEICSSFYYLVQLFFLLRCTVIHGTPTMYVDLIAKQKELKANLDSVQIAVTGGAPCSPNLFRQMLDELKVKKVKVS